MIWGVEISHHLKWKVAVLGPSTITLSHLPSSLVDNLSLWLSGHISKAQSWTKQNNTTIDYAVFHIQTKEMERLQSPQSPTICRGSTFPTWPKRTSSHPFFSNHPAKPSQSILVERGIPWNGEKFMKPPKCRWLWSVFVQNNFILIDLIFFHVFIFVY